MTRKVMSNTRSTFVFRRTFFFSSNLGEEPTQAHTSGSRIKLTNRFQAAARPFSKRSQMTSKCGKNKKVAHEAQPIVTLMFLPHFDVLYDLLLNRRTATWNLFVLCSKELKKVSMMTSSIRLSSNRS